MEYTPLTHNGRRSPRARPPRDIEEQVDSLLDGEEEEDTMFSPSRPSKLPWPLTSLSSDIPWHSRLIDRDGLFHQSHGKFSIRKKIKIKEWRTIYGSDWFHSLVDSPTWKIISILMCWYLLMITIFAVPYYYIARFNNDMCNYDVKNFREAYMLSLETMATIGYSTKDIFFGDCVLPAVILTAQVCMRIIADAVTIGIIYSRLSRPSSRASTIIFSNNAIIRRIKGKLYFMFQTCELRKHQLVEAHVRLYAIKSERDESAYQNINPRRLNSFHSSRYFKTYPLRICHPSDERGAMLLLCLPQLIVHEIDERSPFYPPQSWRSIHTGGILLNFMSTTAPVTATAATATAINGESPMRYVDDLYGEAETNDQRLERELIQAYMMSNKMEVVAIIEGADQSTGSVVQARHSYISKEIQWNHTYAPCVLEDEVDGSAVVDFNRFHKTIEVIGETNTPDHMLVS